MSRTLQQLRDNGLIAPEVIAERPYYLKENPTSPVILLQLVRLDQRENNFRDAAFAC
jgi:hypothetical protein